MTLARLHFLSLLPCDTVPKALLTLRYVTDTTFTLTTDFATLPQVGITPICHKALAVCSHLLDSPCSITNGLVIYFRYFFPIHGAWADCSVFAQSPPSPSGQWVWHLEVSSLLKSPDFPLVKTQEQVKQAGFGCCDAKD